MGEKTLASFMGCFMSSERLLRNPFDLPIVLIFFSCSPLTALADGLAFMVTLQLATLFDDWQKISEGREMISRAGQNSTAS